MNHVYAEVALFSAHNPKVNPNIEFLKMVKVNLRLDDKGVDPIVLVSINS